MRPFGTQKQLGKRRINAIRLIESGEWTVADAAHKAKVAVRTVYSWLSRYRKNGEDAIAAKPLPGRKPANELSGACDLRRRRGLIGFC